MRRTPFRAAAPARSSNRRSTPRTPERAPLRGLTSARSAAASFGLLSGLLWAGAALPSCAPAVVAGAAVLVNDDFVANAQSVVINEEVDYVWTSARRTMSHMTEDLLDVDEELRTIQTYVDGARVIVHVETYKAGETRVRVAAKRYLVYSDEVAANVRDGIVRDLN